MIGSLTGESLDSAKTLPITTVAYEDRVVNIFKHLDKSFAMDETDRLDINLDTFLDYGWRSAMSVENFIPGFHTLLNNISELNFDSKLKEHLMLKQSGLDMHTDNMIVGAAS